MTDGTRTRDIQSHNLELYRLSYGHHKSLLSPKPLQIASHFSGILAWLAFGGESTLLFHKNRKGLHRRFARFF